MIVCMMPQCQTSIGCICRRQVNTLSSFKAETGVDVDGRDDGDRKSDDLLVEELLHVFTMDCGPGVSLSQVIMDGMAFYYSEDDPEGLKKCVGWIKRQVCKNALSVLSKDANASGPQDTTAHTVEREKGFREGIEAAAKVAAEQVWKSSVTARFDGDPNDHYEAACNDIEEAIRSLSSERPADIADRPAKD